MRSIYSSMFVCLLLAACDGVEPTDQGAGDGELITRVTLTLKANGETVTASAVDPDGDGAGFQIDELVLNAANSYTGSIEVADEVNDQDITAEIDRESDDHQFFYTPGGGVADRLTVVVTDQDINGLPVGLEFQAITTAGGAATGTLNVVLSHFAQGPKDGTNRSDDTDIDVTFPVIIQ